MRKVLSFVLVLILVMGMFCVSVYADTGPGINDLTGITDIFSGFSIVAVAVIGIVGFLAFCVSGIVQLTKKLPFIWKIPTDLYVIIVSLITCQFVLFMGVAWYDMPMEWYYIGLAAFMSLAVSFVALFGWREAYALYLRFSNWRNRLKT